MTYNMVHGTRRPFPSRLVPTGRIERNLSRIAAMMDREGSHVVALQEADGGSKVDRVRHLSESGGFPSWFHDGLAESAGKLRHGAALLSRLQLSAASSHAFSMGMPKDKGWVQASLAVPAWRGATVDVVSVHLDPFSSTTRRRQIERLTADLRNRAAPLIVCGDMNCSWHSDLGGGVRTLAELLSLQAHAPQDDDPTFSLAGVRGRFDWILISDQLEFVDHHVVADRSSDHFPVVADVKMRE